MNISLLLIATNKYKRFVQPLIDSVKKYFLAYHDVTIHLFTDKLSLYEGNNRVKIQHHIIPSYKFPEATLLRYKIFTSIPEEAYGDYIFYLDVDMRIVNVVRDTDIFGELVAVRHPGYYRGGGTWETNPLSMCYTYPDGRIEYYAGGFQGGDNDTYYTAMETMRDWINTDLENGIMPIWHDESAWNEYVQSAMEHRNIKILSPSYCMPEVLWKRELWGVDELTPRILALEKENGIRG